jgi:integrase/recombinase XerC
MTELPALIEAPSAVAAVDTGSRLYEAFLAGRTAQTRRAYAADLADFAAYVGEASGAAVLAHVSALGHGEANGLLLGYRASLVDKGLTPATINRRLAAVRSAIKLARTLGWSTWVPEVAGLKVQAWRDTAGPGLEGARAMLAAASQQSPAKALRDAALIRLFFDLALRCAEVRNLNLADLESDGRRIWIKGKGRTQKEARTVPPKTCAALRAWTVARATVAPADEQALFIGLGCMSLGRRITDRGIYHVISTLGSDVGIKTRPHGLRHASITTALDKSNGDVRAVQQHARHSSPEMTIRYDDNRRDLAGIIAAGLAEDL